MHNSYYFLNSVSAALERRLKGYTLVSCFSQSKDELLIEFNNGIDSFFLKASLLPELQCLSFPAQINRARKNSVDLFHEVLMKKITGARTVKNDRSLILDLDGDAGLLFKMHGNQSNVLCIENDKPTGIFRKNLEQDLEIVPSVLDREVDWTEKGFQSATDLAHHYFTFGREVWAYLDENNFKSEDSSSQWKMLTELRKKLEAPAVYYHVEYRSGLVFSLLPFGKVVDEFHDPLEAVTAFVSAYTSRMALDRERRNLISRLAEAIKKTKQYLAKTDGHLNDITKDKHFQLWGDLLMANLGKIKEGDTSVALENLYDENKPVQIKLNPQLSPQKNAGVYYRKSKNRAIEIGRLEQVLGEKRTALATLEVELANVKNVASLKELRALSTSFREEKQSTQTVKLPYREVEFKGYRIWVGKDGASNDQLTFKFGFKEDMWLHAKDVAGSHVLIKHQAGKNYPKDVIERAAQLAAFFSKRKGEALCPVAMTEKKFVRKRKGDPAGMVVVEKEKVILVEPKGV